MAAMVVPTSQYGYDAFFNRSTSRVTTTEEHWCYLTNHHDLLFALRGFYRNDDITKFYCAFEHLVFNLVRTLVKQVCGCSNRQITQDDVTSLEALKGLCSQDEEIIRIVRREEPRLTEYLFSVIKAHQTDESYPFAKAATGLLIALDPEYLCTMRDIKDAWVAFDVLQAVEELIREDDLHSVTPEMTRNAIELAFDAMQSHGTESIMKRGLYVITEAAGSEPPNRAAVEYLTTKNICELIVNMTRSNPDLVADTTSLVIALASLNEVRRKLLSLDFPKILLEELTRAQCYSDKLIKWIIYCIATIAGPASIIDLLQMMKEYPCMITSDFRLIRIAFESLKSHLSNVANDAFDHDYINIIQCMTGALREVFSQQRDGMLELVPGILGVLQKAVYRQKFHNNRNSSPAESQILRDCLFIVFETMKKISKNEEVVRAAVEVIGYIIEDNPISQAVDNQVVNEIMAEFRNIQGQHISSAKTQHWILWATLACKGLPMMLEFMNRNESSSAVQQAAISSIVEYFDEDKQAENLCQTTALEDQGVVKNAAEMLRNGLQLHYTQREEGIKALALLCVQCDQLPLDMYEYILLTLEKDDHLEHRTSCVRAIRLFMQKWPSLEITQSSLVTINNHLHYSLPARGKWELFADGFYILANCQGVDTICENLNREYSRPHLYYCAFRALTDLFRIRRPPDNLGQLQASLTYAAHKFGKYQGVVNSVHLLTGLLGLPSIEMQSDEFYKP